MDNKKTHFCEPCKFRSANKADYVRHCNTNKHKLNCNKNYGLMDNKKTQKNALSFRCGCGKEYKYKSGLCKHQNNCNFLDSSLNNYNKYIDKDVLNKIENEDYKTMFFKLLDENKEFKDILVKQQTQISELIPRVGNNTINTVNNVNQKLNINIFLKEQCKDALNIEDFVKNIEIDMDQLGLLKIKVYLRIK